MCLEVMEVKQGHHQFTGVLYLDHSGKTIIEIFEKVCIRKVPFLIAFLHPLQNNLRSCHRELALQAQREGSPAFLLYNICFTEEALQKLGREC